MDYGLLPQYIISCVNRIVQVPHQLTTMMAMRIFIPCDAYLLCNHLLVGLQVLSINRDHSNLSYIPQDLNSNVTALSLARNDIAVINSSSLLRYPKLEEHSLNFNPLQEIILVVFEGVQMLCLYIISVSFGLWSCINLLERYLVSLGD